MVIKKIVVYLYSKNDNKHGRGRYRGTFKSEETMKTYIYNTVELNANEFRAVCLNYFPGLRYSRKHTIWENIKRLAEKGNEKAIKFCQKVVEK